MSRRPQFHLHTGKGNPPLIICQQAQSAALEDHTETVQNEGSAEFSASDQSVPEVEEKQEDVVDEELNRIVGLFKLSREQGYTLKLIPGTPEENAPVFDFENERILRPAA